MCLLLFIDHLQVAAQPAGLPELLLSDRAALALRLHRHGVYPHQAGHAESPAHPADPRALQTLVFFLHQVRGRLTD